MNRYPAPRPAYRPEWVSVSPEATPAPRRTIFALVGLMLFVAGLALGCVVTAYAELP